MKLLSSAQVPPKLKLLSILVKLIKSRRWTFPVVRYFTWNLKFVSNKNFTHDSRCAKLMVDASFAFISIFFFFCFFSFNFILCTPWFHCETLQVTKLIQYSWCYDTSCRKYNWIHLRWYFPGLFLLIANKVKYN